MMRSSSLGISLLRVTLRLGVTSIRSLPGRDEPVENSFVPLSDPCSRPEHPGFVVFWRCF